MNKTQKPRTEIIQFTCTDTDRTRIENAANNKGLQTASYVRMVVLGNINNEMD